MGYLLEELRDGKNYEQFQRDIADANIFIGSLIFIEELAEKVSRQNRFNLPMLLSGGVANVSMQMQRGVFFLLCQGLLAPGRCTASCEMTQHSTARS